MLAGVNGAGKTTSIGKLAKWLQAQDLSVLLAAGDTFRAAAREQLARVGRAQRRGRDPAIGRRSRGGHVRRRRGGARPRHRRRARRHRRAPADAGAPDGRIAQGEAGAGQGAGRVRRTRCCSSSTPTPARTRSRRSGRSTARSASPASSSPSWTAAPRAASWPPSPSSIRFRCSFIGVGEGRRRPAAVRRPRIRRRAAARLRLTGIRRGGPAFEAALPPSIATRGCRRRRALTS